MKARLTFKKNRHERREAFYGKGRVLLGDDAEELVRETGVAREPMADQGLRCIRRRRRDGWDYFMANLGSQDFDDWCCLSRSFASAAVFDPLTGCKGSASLRNQDNAAHVRLCIKSGQSLIVRTFKSPHVTGGKPWLTMSAAAAIPLEGTWRVEFIEGGPELPPPFTVDRLMSWTECGGSAESFAGTARYQLDFEWQNDDIAFDWLLDLGDIRESARVRVNGGSAGTAWAVPFELRVGEFLRCGKNLLEIEVTNLCANRIRDMDRRGVSWKNLGDVNMLNVKYQPLDASRWKVCPSGLLGPVRLVPLKYVDV